MVINFVGALGPELGFDALWYHLTISKIYLNEGAIFHIPGGLLYYSAMPRLADILFIPLLKLAAEVGPHMLSLACGIGSATLVFLIARKWLDKTDSLLAVLVFYVNPLVGWLSASAYVDLIRTFWETLAVFLVFKKKFALAGIVLGLAISTKTLALGSLPIIIILIFLTTKDFSKTAKALFLAILVGLPWYLLAFLNTGFPFYPIGAGILDSRHSAMPQIMNPISIVADYWNVFLAPEDLINPIFVIVIPFALTRLRLIWSKHKLLLIYFIFTYGVWWIIPRLGGGRFILPYLPLWSILVMVIISYQDKWLKRLLIVSIILISIFNLTYRLGANYKLKDYLLGRESKNEYLCRNLDFNLGVFVDCDGFFSRTIKQSDLVLVKGVHNLYYIDFPYIHESWYQGERVDYTLIQGTQEAGRSDGTLIYKNELSKVRLYSKK